MFNYQKKYEAQKETISELRKENLQLKTDNERLNAIVKSMEETDPDKFRVVTTKVNHAEVKFNKELAKVKDMKKELDAQIRIAKKEQERYRKEMDKLIKEMKETTADIKGE